MLESEGGMAILIGHIPPATDCIHPWSARLRGLMDRYQHIIRFSLFGHTHLESFNVVKSIDKDKNIGLNLIAGSLTPFYNNNPSFTLIEIDEQYLLPLNVKTYYLDITKSNL